MPMANDSSQTILVTGPDGFVGTKVCGALLKRNHVVRGAQWKAGFLLEGCESVIATNILTERRS